MDVDARYKIEGHFLFNKLLKSCLENLGKMNIKVSDEAHDLMFVFLNDTLGIFVKHRANTYLIKITTRLVLTKDDDKLLSKEIGQEVILFFDFMEFYDKFHMIEPDVNVRLLYSPSQRKVKFIQESRESSRERCRIVLREMSKSYLSRENFMIEKNEIYQRVDIPNAFNFKEGIEALSNSHKVSCLKCWFKEGQPLVVFNDEDKELLTHKIEFARGPDKIANQKSESIYTYSSGVLVYGCRFMSREQSLELSIYENEILALFIKK